MSHLTLKGNRKIDAFIKRTRAAAQEALERNVETVLIPAIVKRAPSRKQEEIILVRGEEGNVGRRYRIGGADSYIEELRLPLREAISNDYVRTRKEGNMIIAETGHADIINEMTKLYWRVIGGRVETRETYPYKEGNSGTPNYVQAVEFGGAWQVLPRGDYPLRPEPEITAETIHKTVHPWRMYGGAIRDRATRRRMIANIKRYVKGEAQAEGFKE